MIHPLLITSGSPPLPAPAFYLYQLQLYLVWLWFSYEQHGQSGRLRGATAGHRSPLVLRLEAWGRPPLSGGAAQRLRSHREAVASEPRRTKATEFAASGHPVDPPS